MTQKRRAFQSLLFLSLAIIGKNSLSAQFAGTSYLSAGIGLNIPHTESSISSPKVSYSLSYGYLLNDRITIEVPASYNSISSGVLEGNSVSILPTFFYSLSRGDKYRFDISGSIGFGFDKYQKPKDSLIEVNGTLESAGLFMGLGLKYNYLITSKLGVFAQYRYLYQPQSTDNMSQNVSAGIMLYL